MKIAYDAKRFFQNASGLGNYSRDLVRILSLYHPENEYLLLNKKKTEKGESILKSNNVHFVETSKGPLARQLKMGKDAQSQKAQIFHGLSGELPLKWFPSPIKKVVTIHDLIFERFPQYYSFFDKKIHFWKFKKAAHSADRIIAISEQTKRDIIEFLNVPESKIEVIYQGCHSSFKESQPTEFLSQVAEKFKLPGEFILNVGTIEDRKNLLNIVKAIEGTGIPLVVVGKKSPYFKKVEAFVKKNKMQEQVYFLNDVSMDELAAIYKLSAFFVYPSFFEGFGIPIIEALFSGTAVITSNRSSLPEAGGKYSLYVDPNNHLDLKAKINFLWNNPEERKRLVELSSEHLNQFRDEVIAKKLFDFYKKIL